MQLIKNIKFKIVVLSCLIIMVGVTIYSNTYAKYITYIVEPIYASDPSYENIVSESEFNTKVVVNDVVGVEIIDGSVYTKYDVSLVENYKGIVEENFMIYSHGASAPGSEVIKYVEQSGREVSSIDSHIFLEKIFRVKSKNDEKLKVGKEYNVALNMIEQGKYIIPGFGFGVENNSLDDVIYETLNNGHFM